MYRENSNGPRMEPCLPQKGRIVHVHVDGLQLGLAEEEVTYSDVKHMRRASEKVTLKQ